MELLKSLSVRLGLLFSALSLACGILVYAVPGVLQTAISFLIHSEFNFAPKPFSAANIVIGAVIWFAIGAVVGIVWTKLCDCCKSCKK